jgi:hypothetical protein
MTKHKAAFRSLFLALVVTSASLLQIQVMAEDSDPQSANKANPTTPQPTAAPAPKADSPLTDALIAVVLLLLA